VSERDFPVCLSYRREAQNIKDVHVGFISSGQKSGGQEWKEKWRNLSNPDIDVNLLVYQIPRACPKNVASSGTNGGCSCPHFGSVTIWRVGNGCHSLLQSLL